MIQQYENSEAPAQKRIAAYLMLMRNPEEANKVLKTLKSEQNEQVKSFVSSHIANILESEDPTLSTYVHSYFKCWMYLLWRPYSVKLFLLETENVLRMLYNGCSKLFWQCCIKMKDFVSRGSILTPNQNKYFLCCQDNLSLHTFYQT